MSSMMGLVPPWLALFIAAIVVLTVWWLKRRETKRAE